jgi:polyisoprenyl-phosphate glycosyltransferase
MTKGISVVIPAFNEGQGVGLTVERIKLQTSHLCCPVEILVVDDGSEDETEALAKKVGARTLRHPHNLGYGAALKTGIRGASYDTIVISDADGTYPADAIPQILDLYGRGYDMVVGARTGQSYRGSALKWPMRLILRFLVEWTTGRRIPDINSGLRVFSRERMTRFLPTLSNSFSFTTSATLVYMLGGLFVIYVPIKYDQRIGQSHVRMWRDSLRTLQYIVRTIALFNPMKLFVLLTIFCGLGGIAALFLLFLAGRWDLGLLVLAISTLVAILVFALGLVVEALRRNNLGFDGADSDPAAVRFDKSAGKPHEVE